MKKSFQTGVRDEKIISGKKRAEMKKSFQAGVRDEKIISGRGQR